MKQKRAKTTGTYRFINKLWLNNFRNRIKIVAIQCKKEIANFFTIDGLLEQNGDFFFGFGLMQNLYFKFFVDFLFIRRYVGNCFWKPFLNQYEILFELYLGDFRCETLSNVSIFYQYWNLGRME